MIPDWLIVAELNLIEVAWYFVVTKFTVAQLVVLVLSGGLTA